MSCPSARQESGSVKCSPLADCRVQENFQLKLEQGNVNFQHTLETLEDNELDKILEVLKFRNGTSEDKIAFVLRNNSWSKHPVFQ